MLVQHQLALTKLAVFLVTMHQAGWNRFSSVYMLARGFTPSQIGRIKSTSQVAKVLAQPLWGIISDSIDPLSALVVSTFLGTLTLNGVRGAMDARNMDGLVTWRIVRSCATVASPAMDALVLRLVEGTSEGYGQQRLWGSIAWGLSSFCAGAMLDCFGEGAIFAYTYATGGLLLVFLLALRRVIPNFNNHDREYKKEESQSAGVMCRIRIFARDILRETNSFPVWAILIHSFGYGTMMVLFDGILMLQLEHDFGISRSVQGVFTLISISGSLPVYHYSGRLKEKIGHWGMIQSSIVVSVLRLCLTKFCCSKYVPHGTRATWLLLLQLLHGYHFAANWVASVELLDTLASRRLRSTMQFLLNMTYFTVGAGVGNLWFSSVYEQQGGEIAYNRGLLLCLVDFILMWSLKVYNNGVVFDREESLEIVTLV